MVFFFCLFVCLFFTFCKNNIETVVKYIKNIYCCKVHKDSQKFLCLIRIYYII